MLRCFAVAVLVWTEAFAQTQNSYPMLMSLRPVAVQVGQTTECEVSARYNLYGATRVFVSGEGVSGEVVPAEKKEGDKPADPMAAKPNVPKLKMRFIVAADAVPGPRDFRIATPQGASTVGQLVVVRDPIVSESGDNNTLAKAQMITVPATVSGAIEAAEDLDYYKFQVDAGSSLIFHVWAMRLEDRIHDLQEHIDPILTIRNAAGTTVAACDNHFAADPLLFHRFEQAGEYTLEVRDVRYKGNADWVYAVEINSRPFITQAHPVAVAPGVETTIALVGHNVPPNATATLQVPVGSPPGVRAIAPLVAGQQANAVAVFVTPLPIVVDGESQTPGGPSQSGAPSSAPTPSASSNSPDAGAARVIAVPSVVCGRLEKPYDVDRFTFNAKSGDRFSFEVIARRADSGLDSFLRVVNAQGGVIAEVDDMTSDRVQSQDSWLENWTAPADGAYTVELRDLHLRGGPEFTYALRVTAAEPYFTLEIDTDKTLLAPGISAPIYVRAVRKNGFAGEVQLGIEGLPACVTATAGRILAGGQDGCILLHAAPDAPMSTANIRITGTAQHPNPVKDAEPLRLHATARPLQEYYSPGGGRGNYPVEMHTVSVADLMDIRRVLLSTNSMSLKPGESQKIEITIERAPGFKGNVTLDVIYQHLEQPYGNSLPRGVAVDVATSKTLLTGDESKGFITLKAAADAPPVEKQLVPVMAHVSVNFVMKMTYSGEPMHVTVLAGDMK